MTNLEQLLSCPFCGDDPIVEPCEDTSFVGCQQCQVYFHEFTTEAAKKRWNTRTPPHEPTDTERLKALANLVWETRWVSDQDDYQRMVGIAAEIRSGNFKVIDAVMRQPESEAGK